MAAQRKYPQEPRERATRVTGRGTTSADAARIAELERQNRELRKVNEILRTASAFFAAAEVDRRLR